MRVYKCYAAKWAWEAIINRRLKLATLSDINDPFEFRAIGGKDKRVRSITEGVIGRFHSKIGFVSFCENRKNPVIWSHYADKYQGVCLGFDVHDDFLNKINYVSERSNFSEADYWEAARDRQKFAELLLTTKFSHWNYEAEQRVLFKLKEEAIVHEKGLCFAPFKDNFSLREIILGPKYNPPTDDTTISELHGAIAALKRCTVKTGRLAFNTFEVVLQNDKSLQKKLL
tara:strand:+ start:532 stop:1215 length:684 start_codon:yes stop_codon:yes gene_type:complete